ncbi:Probable inactive receptor kinase [Striga hermonthica]|uniref:Probable inactive receptor kinase n=1 Tax=Striga hermonthica TaxID=68872 RepID=A0A9N7R066_STRHE|nr:Probable inactive receptor kinase [Striga hermonthica]
MSVMKNWNHNLEALDLSSNGLRGSLPSLTHFEKMTLFSIRNNSLEGPLPLTLGHKLVTVDLSSNRFDGPIPHSFLTSVTITNLNLSDNHLTGPIPIQDSHTTKLLLIPTILPMKSLDLSNNALNGELPSNIGFAKEMKKIGYIRHQNIVPLRAYYWGPREQERLILADYVLGDSLALHLYGKFPLSFNQRLTVATDIARCLLFLHDRGLPHGNLKPTNIILCGPNYTVQLTDYGLHRLMTRAGIAEQILNLGGPRLPGA